MITLINELSSDVMIKLQVWAKRITYECTVHGSKGIIDIILVQVWPDGRFGFLCVFDFVLLVDVFEAVPNLIEGWIEGWSVFGW
jgi:hypothetical protein